MLVIDLTDIDQPRIIGEMPQEIWVDTHSVKHIVSGDRVYVLVADTATYNADVWIVDVSQPDRPVKVGYHRLIIRADDPGGGIAGMDASGDYVYLVSSSAGLYVLRYEH